MVLAQVEWLSDIGKLPLENILTLTLLGMVIVFFYLIRGAFKLFTKQLELYTAQIEEIKTLNSTHKKHEVEEKIRDNRDLELHKEMVKALKQISSNQIAVEETLSKAASSFDH